MFTLVKHGVFTSDRRTERELRRFRCPESSPVGKTKCRRNTFPHHKNHIMSGSQFLPLSTRSRGSRTPHRQGRFKGVQEFNCMYILDVHLRNDFIMYISVTFVVLLW